MAKFWTGSKQIKSRRQVKRIKKIEGKGENSSYQHFPPFQQCFRRPFFYGILGIAR